MYIDPKYSNSHLNLFYLRMLELKQLIVFLVHFWANAAAQSGYTVNNTPKAGAVMQTTQGGYGHVAY
jgi:hypothetical protein